MKETETEHDCDADGYDDTDICSECREHSSFCSICGLSSCCGSPAPVLD